jgi:hypothetical protein
MPMAALAPPASSRPILVPPIIGSMSCSRRAAPATSRRTAVADTGDATEKGGTNNGTGGLAATGNVLTNDTDPNAGDTKTVSAVSFGATAGTLGAGPRQSRAQCFGHVHLYSE